MVIVLIGPAGAGKTTVGRALADALGWRFVDADDFHSEENRTRLSRGESLSDADRAPWLVSLRDVIERAVDNAASLVLACSALKRSYREALLPRAPHVAGKVRFVYLKVSPRELAQRLEVRVGHFAPPALLASQLATWEEPDADEGILTIDGGLSTAELVALIQQALDVSR